MKLKKKILLGVVVAVAIGGVAFLKAANYQSQSLINGTSTSFKILSALNVVLTVGQGSTTADSADYTNDLGQLVYQGTNSAGITYGPWIRPARGFSDANGNAGAATVFVTILSRAANNSTNGITFNIGRSTDGTYYDTVGTGLNGGSGIWSFSITNTSPTTDQTFVTNVPSWFITGANYIRLNSIVFATNGFATTNAIKVNLAGFTP